MVNTVGSHRNKNWTKKWSKIKKNIFLTSQQRSILVGSLLGDGTMRVGENAQNANFKIEHGLQQTEFVFHKYEYLKNWVFTPPHLSCRYSENGEKYLKSWWFRTIRHPLLTDLYKIFYTGNEFKTGKKIVPKNISHNLDPLALAIWIIDDGSFNKKKIDISTHSFTEEYIIILQNALKNRYDLKAKYFHDCDKGIRMYFDIENTNKLVKIIHPYIIPSMEYKIGVSIDPVTTGFSCEE